MAVLFVSHSSKDDTAIGALEEWLLGHGFTDIFIDHSNISGGEKWAEALREASGACRVVVCFVTERWLASDECFGEFKAAWYMGKRIIPLLALDPGNASSSERLTKVLAEDQGLDVAPCMAENGRHLILPAPAVERRLEAGLRAAGALARSASTRHRRPHRKLRPMPFPGLTSFGDDDADAALFYGRSREIVQSLEEIRTVRTKGDLRPFVILGASGAGKSSLLKAGIIPRLRREAPAWLPMRAFRPGADPLLNFADALARSLADFGKIEAPGVIRDSMFDAWSKAERTNGGLTPAGRAALEVALEAEAQAAPPPASARRSRRVDQAERWRGRRATAPTRWETTFVLRWRRRQAVGSSPSRSAPTASPSCKAIAASRRWRRGAMTCAPYRCIASTGWSRSRQNGTALRSIPRSSMRSWKTRRGRTTCRCWHSLCNVFGASMPPLDY